MGYDLLEQEDFRHREPQYREILEKERFFHKMSAETKKNFMESPLNFSMMMVSNGDADGVVAGAVT